MYTDRQQEVGRRIQALRVAIRRKYEVPSFEADQDFTLRFFRLRALVGFERAREVNWKLHLEWKNS